MSRRHPAFAPLQVLLVQARTPGSPILEHERQCVETRLKTTHSVVTTVNVVETRLSRYLDAHRDVDAIILGGSGEFSVVRTPAKWLDDYLEDLRLVVMRDLPIFGICFGLQVLVAAMGGDIVHDAANAESGALEVALTTEGRSDEVFGRLPGKLLVLTEHQDRAARLPVGVDILARGRTVAVQAIRVTGRPIYAVQFHPELDAQAMQTRQLFYRENFACMFDGVEGCGPVQDCGAEGPRMIRYFIETVRRSRFSQPELPLVA